MFTASQAPTTADRREIAARIEVLAASLDQRAIDRTASAVAELLIVFDIKDRDPAAAKARAKGFMTALDDLPSWAVEGACRAWLRGEVDGGASRYAPAPPELRKAAIQQMTPVLRQRRMLQRVLDAEVLPEYTAEERAAQQDRMARLSAMLATKKDEPSKAPTREAAE